MDEIRAIKEHIGVMLNMDRDNNLKLIKDEIESGKYGGQYVNDVLFTKINVNGKLY